MQRQLPSCGHCDGEENHSKSMWDVLSFSNLSSPSRPESFRRKSQEVERTLPFCLNPCESAFLSICPVFSEAQGGTRLLKSWECSQLLCFGDNGHMWHLYPLLIIITDFTTLASAFQNKLLAKSVCSCLHWFCAELFLSNHKQGSATLWIWTPLTSMSLAVSLSFVHNKVHVD